jgi:hypothetical protein
MSALIVAVPDVRAVMVATPREGDDPVMLLAGNKGMSRDLMATALATSHRYSCDR